MSVDTRHSSMVISFLLRSSPRDFHLRKAAPLKRRMLLPLKPFEHSSGDVFAFSWSDVEVVFYCGLVFRLL